MEEHRCRVLQELSWSQLALTIAACDSCTEMIWFWNCPDTARCWCVLDCWWLLCIVYDQIGVSFGRDGIWCPWPSLTAMAPRWQEMIDEARTSLERAEESRCKPGQDWFKMAKAIWIIVKLYYIIKTIWNYTYSIIFYEIYESVESSVEKNSIHRIKPRWRAPERTRAGCNMSIRVYADSNPSHVVAVHVLFWLEVTQNTPSLTSGRPKRNKHWTAFGKRLWKHCLNYAGIAKLDNTVAICGRSWQGQQCNVWSPGEKGGTCKG